MIDSWNTHFKKTLALAAPVMLSQAGQVTVNVADSAMVGRLGKTALGAVSLGNAVFISILVLAIGFTFAMSPLIAEADAKKDTNRVKSILSHGLILNVSLGFLLAIVGWLTLPIMHMLNQPTDVVALAIPYIKVSLMSLLPLMVFQSVRQLSEGLSLTIPVTIATIVANIINIVLNYAWIYGNFGFPRLEVLGAAYGTLVARIAMVFILILVLIYWGKSKTYLTQFSIGKLENQRFLKILGLGLPTAAQMFFEVSAFSAAAFICGLAGKDDLAAHQIAINLASITFLLCTGLAVASTIRVGNQLGLKNYANLKRVGWSAMIMVAIFMIVCGVLFILLNDFFPTLYIDNQTVISIAAQLLIVAAFFQLSDGIQVVCLGALRGMQDVLIPTGITLIAYWIITMPLAYYLAVPQAMGSFGVWIALGLGLTISAAALVMRFHYKSGTIAKQNQFNENEIDLIGRS